MDILSNIHTHTIFCDGQATAEEMVQQAIALHYRSLGFSGHVYLDFDQSYCMSQAGTSAYQQEIQRLKEQYQGKLDILCGIEQDCFSTEPTTGYDFVLGACHYAFLDGKHLPVDLSKEQTIHDVDTYFQGDYLAYTANYYAQVAHLADHMQPDVVAHFDLVTKFNEDNCLFDENDPAYQQPALAALEALVEKGCRRFEVNTGAIYRRCRSTPYPAFFLLKAMQEMGLRIVFGSDSHSVPSLGYGFSAAVELAKTAGFEEADILTSAGFCPVRL